MCCCMCRGVLHIPADHVCDLPLHERAVSLHRLHRSDAGARTGVVGTWRLALVALEFGWQQQWGVSRGAQHVTCGVHFDAMH